MAATKDSFAEAVERLVRKFDADRETYLSPGYPETQARTHFISPFFKALGWDVENEQGLPYHLCEVWEEKGETQGRPDYTFRLGSQTKFFVEAKAPSEELDNVQHILQTKRYAWNSRDVYFAGLTDFEAFRFFDASLEPDLRRPLVGEAFHFLYTEYLKNLDTLWELSRERVEAGSLDRFLSKDRKEIRYRVAVDKRFLDELTEWRLDLARTIHQRNASLDARLLNEIVQRLLDRIVFIRIAEDRKIIEPYQLRDLVELWEQRGGRREIMDDLVGLFRQINEDFNGEIFKPHPCEEVKVESAALAKIIRRLYPPLSPYRFDVIGVEMLGSIYERYLGNTLHVTAKQVRLEPKPEVRKAGGVYYTPRFIVDYIVKNTVGKLVEGKKPKDVEKLRILDPACGSGSFLIGAYQFLIDWHLDYYREHRKEARLHPMYPEVEKDLSGNPRLSFHAKTRILSHNLYGVDLDPQAVEITMMSLYLKALEGEHAMLGPKHEKLPELKYNIRCGNSLIGPDINKEHPLTPEERERIRPFDWHSREEGFGDILAEGGFDAVIGNPPYGDTMSSEEKDYLLSVGFRAGGSGNNDIFRFMFENSLNVVREGSSVGMILPNTFLVGSKYTNFRRRLLDLGAVEEIVDFGVRKVFDIDVYSSILFVRRETSHKKRHEGFASYRSNGLPPAELLKIKPILKADRGTLLLSDWIPTNPISEKICRNPRFGPADEFVEIKDAGINYQRVGVGWQKRAESKLASRILYEGKQRHTLDRAYLKGEDIEPFCVKAHALNRRWLRHDYKKFIQPGEVVAFGKKILEAPAKIVSRQTGDTIIAAIDRRQLYTGRSLHSWVMRPGQSISIELLLGILNSKFITYLYQASTREKGRALAQVKLNKLKKLPLPRVDSLPPGKRKACAAIERLVKRIVDRKGGLDRDRFIVEVEELVYELYGITAEERKTIEEAVGENGDE